MVENTNCLSSGQNVPNVRRYHFLQKIDAFDLKASARHLVDPCRGFGGFGTPAFIKKITDEEKIMVSILQKASFFENKTPPKNPTRRVRPSLKQSKTLSSIRRGPQNTEKYLRTSGTPPRPQQKPQFSKFTKNGQK